MAQPTPSRPAYPPVILKYWYAFDWDVREIWALDLPTETMPIDNFLWLLQTPVWPSAQGPYTVTPMEVWEQPGLHTAEHARVLNADTSHPLDVTFYKNRWLILDGIHRLLKHHASGTQQIPVRVVPEKYRRFPQR